MLPLPSEASRLGSVLTDHQEKLLLDNFEQVVLMFDGDQGGRSAAFPDSAVNE